MPFAKLFAHLHPMLVHFPIALLAVALVFEWIALARRRPAYGPATRGLLIVGVIGAALAVFSGLELETDDDVSFDGEGLVLIERHKDFGIIGGCAALAAFVLGEIHRKKGVAATRILYLVVLHVTVGAILFAGKLGGESHWGLEWLPW